MDLKLTIQNMFIQGGNQLLTKSMAQLWPHFESFGTFEPTWDFLDVVCLINKQGVPKKRNFVFDGP